MAIIILSFKIVSDGGLCRQYEMRMSEEMAKTEKEIRYSVQYLGDKLIDELSKS